MALIKCPECGESVSDKAPNCPHCGLAIAGNIIPCPECGAVVPKGTETCPKCAFPLQEVKEQVKNVEATPAPQKPAIKASEEVLEKIGPVFLEAKELYEKKKYVSAYDKINIALSAAPNNTECLKLEAAIVSGICDHSQKVAEELFQAKEYAKALAEIDGALKFAPNSQALLNLSNEIKRAKSRRKTRITVISVLVVIAIAVVAAMSIRKSFTAEEENQAWEIAKDSNTVSCYNQFLEDYPDGAHSMDAQEMLMKLQKDETDFWGRIQSSSDVYSYEQYLKKFPQGMYVDQAKNSIDSLDWVKASKKNTPEAFAEYLAAHPEGAHVGEAQSANEKIAASVPTAEEISGMKSFFSNYYAAVENKDESSVLDFFESVTPKYYGISNASKSDIQANIKKMYAKDIKQVHIKINDASFKVTKDESGNYHVTFPIDVTYDREDAAKTNTSSMNVTAVVNGNQKITSIISNKSNNTL